MVNSLNQQAHAGCSSKEVNRSGAGTNSFAILYINTSTIDTWFGSNLLESFHILDEERKRKKKREREGEKEKWENQRIRNREYKYITSVCWLCLLPSSSLAKNEPYTALPVHAQYDDAIRAWVIVRLQNFFHDPLDLGSFTYLAVDGGHEFHHVGAVNRLLFLEKPHRGRGVRV